MTPNEARARMDLGPYVGGDEFYLGLQGAVIDPEVINPLGVDEFDADDTDTEFEEVEEDN